MGFTLLVLLLPGAVLQQLTEWLQTFWPGSAPDASTAAGHFDKLVHAGLFLFCGLFLARGWWLPGQSAWPLLLSLILFAVLTELLQLLVPGRGADFWDVVADTVGAAIGLWLGRPRQLGLPKAGEHSILVDGAEHLLYDPSLVGCQPAALFRRSGMDSLQRGSALFFQHQGQSMVLKRYYRGGLIGHLNRRWYFAGFGQEPRMWQEYRLLLALRDRGLPVPVPVAARADYRCCLAYSGELITLRIAPVQTLAERLASDAMPAHEWRTVGATLADFHRQGVFHADLNASNILLDRRPDAPAPVYLIDFDKGAIREGPSRAWRQANLMRLRRSLDKPGRTGPGLHFQETDWRRLLNSYEERLKVEDEQQD